MSIDRLHHRYSPSSLQAREACPKYANSFNASEAATIGTKQHSVAETGEDDPELSDEKAFGVATSLQFLSERRALHLGHTLLTETYLPIDAEETTAGYIDAAIISADQRTAEIVDFKYGKIAVESAESNLQMAAYALGLLHKFPTLEKITAWLVLPHRDEVSGCEFSRADLERLRLRIKTVVARAVEADKNPDDFSSARANQGACMWCANLGRCPAVAAVALKVGKKYSPLEVPESISTSVFSDPQQVAAGLRLAGIIKVWSEAFRAQATAKSIESDFIPEGFKLVSTVKRSVVKAKIFGDLAKTYLPPEDFEKVEALYEIGIGKVEKLISTAAPRGTKEAAVEKFGAAALAAGAVVEGAPFAYLKQDNSK